MSQQLQIKFPLFPEGLFKKVREFYQETEAEKQLKEINHMKRVIAGFKGYRTKRKKNK